MRLHFSVRNPQRKNGIYDWKFTNIFFVKKYNDKIKKTVLGYVKRVKKEEYQIKVKNKTAMNC